jgi:16S rRNA (cytosine1402-N4)-methyltransferase
MALAEVGVERVDVLLADLGISSAQLDDPLRGLSFQQDGPLDMRLDDRLEETAEDIVNRMRERELADLIFYNSQERFSRRIAKRICYVRKGGRIKRTGELMEIVCAAIGAQPDSRKSKIHPATRVFQALRIAVNREMEHLETLLSKAPAVLRPGGRIGVISFHSLEDGMVKRDFRARKAEGVYEILTKRPVIAEEEERDRNPRSRSAKLRVARRL